MRSRNLRWVLLCLLLSCGRVLSPASTPHPGCADFLADWQPKLPHTTFQSCRTTKLAQLNVLEAIYHVPGEYAKVVEAQLVRRFQMAPLRFLCCGWESAGNAAVFVDAKGYRYEIRMTSGETLEKDWKKIPIFTVSVSKLLENP